MQKSDNFSDTKRSLISEGTKEKDEVESIKIATAGDIKKVRLEVKKNTFVSVNGVEIEENTNFSSDIRNLLNHLVSREKVTNTKSYKGKTKGIIKTTCKTMLKVVNCEESNTEKSIKINDKERISDCQKGHPELLPSSLGLIRFCDDPKPRFIKEGSEIFILGSILIGERPHWLKGEIKDNLDPITVTNKNIIMAKSMTIHNPILVNYWAEICGLKVQKPISIMIDKELLVDLELIRMNQDLRISEKSGASASSNVKETPVFERDRAAI